jgi:hypothetical protein
LRHSWGEFIYSFCGLIDVKVGKNSLLAPPHLGLWIAPQAEHTCFNHREAAYCSLYIRQDLCAGMPEQTCALLVTPLVRTILEHLRSAARRRLRHIDPWGMPPHRPSALCFAN